MPVWGLLLAMLTATLWAISPVLMKEGMKGAGPNEVNPVRSIAFFLTMLACMIYFQPGKWPTLTPLLVLGVVLNTGTSVVLGDLLYIYSIEKIGASLAVSISCGYPLITTLFSIVILKETITPLVWCGTILIIAGLLTIRYDAMKKNKEEPAYTLETPKENRKQMMQGILLALGAAFFWGANIPFLKKMMVIGQWTPVESYFIRSTFFLFLVWALRLVQHLRFPHSIRPLNKLSFKTWAAFLGSGAFGMGLGGIFFAICISRLPVSAVTPITASSPIITVALSRILLKEKLSRLQAAGVFLVILGSIAVSL